MSTSSLIDAFRSAAHVRVPEEVRRIVGMNNIFNIIDEAANEKLDVVLASRDHPEEAFQSIHRKIREEYQDRMRWKEYNVQEGWE